MTIGIDARLYGLKNRGLGRYVKALVENLIPSDQTNDYVVFLTKENFQELDLNYSNYQKVLINARWYSLKEQLFLPAKIKQSGVDLMYFPHFNVPLFYTGKFVVMIHDLIIDHFPDSRATTLPLWFYRIKLWFYRLVTRQAVKKAAAIIVPSEYVKKDLERLYQADQKKVKVIYEGYFIKEHQPDSLDSQKLGITKPYLLYVGAAYPHKNLERLIKVFQQINDRGQYQLVLVGPLDYFYRRLRSEVKATDLVFTDYLTDGQLQSLYRQATLFVFPSLSEGFGFPPLEAQANGVPVVSANSSSLPEVLDDSCLYFDPLNEDQMRRQIEKVLNDQQLKEQLIIKGKENYSRFSLAKMIEEIMGLFNNLP